MMGIDEAAVVELVAAGHLHARADGTVQPAVVTAVRCKPL